MFRCLLPCAEAVCRGYKLGLLTTADYNNICQCETLDDIKLYLVRTAGVRAICDLAHVASFDALGAQRQQ